MKKSLFLIAATFSTTVATAQWTRVIAIHPQNLRAIALLADTILTTSQSNVLYRSRDGGLNWDSLIVSNNSININCLKVIDNKIFVGTANNGIFTSDDFGVSWVHTGTGLLTISDSVKHGNDFYASTLGGGVYVFDQQQNNWLPFNDSLPSYSVNVNSMVSTPNSLLIGAGSNGTFYRYNFAINGWNEEFYDGMLHPSLMINRLINHFDTIFAVCGNRVIRSEDNGLTWTNDNFGTHNGSYRIIAEGEVNHYLVTNVTTGTWIQQRDRNSSSGTSWAGNQEIITNGFSFDILEHGNTVFLGMLDGLFVKSISTGMNAIETPDCAVQIFMNTPEVSITSKCNIVSYSITNVAGQVLSSADVMRNVIDLHLGLAQGIYFLKLNFQDNKQVVKRLMIR